MEKLKNFAESVGIKAREIKFAVGAMAASAAVPVVTVMASAEGEPATSSTSTGLAQYSSQITNTFTSMVDDIMPIAIGVLGTGATIFALFIAWKLARKALSTVAK